MEVISETHPPLTAKDAVITWLSTLNNHPESLASIHYIGGGEEAHLKSYNGTVARLTLRRAGHAGEEVAGWEIDPTPHWSPSRRPATTYWGPDPVRILHEHLTKTYSNDTTTNKETP